MSDEATARDALRALGIVPTTGLVRAWLQAAQAEALLKEEVPSDALCQPQKPSSASLPSAVDESRPRHPRGYSKSQLEPVLREQGALERKPGVRRRGRPRIIAKWFKQVAGAMADGTSLRIALRRCGVTNLNLERKQIRALYRNEEFRRMYQEARRKYGRDYYFKRLTREELFRRGL
jgi:hypothetical protein